VLLYTLLTNVGFAKRPPIGIDFTVIITFGIVFPVLYVAALIGTVMQRRWGPALAAVTAVANMAAALFIAAPLVVLALLEYRNIAQRR
jgi:hypothetical protein